MVNQDLPPPRAPERLDGAWLRQLVMEAGADDVGFVSCERPRLAEEVGHLREAFPRAQALVSFVVRMNREPIRSPLRSLSNLEFHHTGDAVNEVAREVVRTLEAHGIQALNPAMGFPMEMSRMPGRIWVISHKLVAEEAGLGVMGIHRNVIHPKFGNFILLGTIAVDRPIDEEAAVLDFNPCLECKLCVAACPVGAVKPDGQFDFGACYTHNYREFLGGFTDFVGQLADAKNRVDLEDKVTPNETVSWWQSLAFGPNYKAAYCMAVCPAGQDVIGPFLEDRKAFKRDVLRPLRDKEEVIYVQPETDAEDHVKQRFPHKSVRHVAGTLQPRSIESFLNYAHIQFQPGRAKTLQATYHFHFTGSEEIEATIRIDQGALTVLRGHHGDPDVRVRVDGDTWLRIIRGRTSPVWAVITGRMWATGNLKRLADFQGCFGRPI